MSAGLPAEAEQNKEVIRRLLAASDRGDLSAVAECYDETYQDHADGGAMAALDKAATLGILAQALQAFPDTRHTILDLLAEGDKVMLRVTARGTHQGAFMGIPPTGRAVSQTQTALYRLRNGRIVERWVDGAESLARLLSGDAGESLGREHPAAARVQRSALAEWRRDVPGAEFWSLRLDRLSFTVFRLEPGTRFPAHAHVSEQITMVLEGELTFEVAGVHHTLRAGDAIAIPAWAPHEVVAGDLPVLAVDAWSPPPEHLGAD